MKIRTNKNLMMLGLLAIATLLIIISLVYYIANKEKVPTSSNNLNAPLYIDWKEFPVRELKSEDEISQSILNSIDVINNIKRFSFETNTTKAEIDTTQQYSTFYEVNYTLEAGQIQIARIGNTEYIKDLEGNQFELTGETYTGIQDQNILLWIVEGINDQLDESDKFNGEYVGLVDCEGGNKCHKLKYQIPGYDAFEELKLDAKYLRPVKYKIDKYEYNFSYEIKDLEYPKDPQKLNSSDSSDKINEICTELEAIESLDPICTVVRIGKNDE